MLAALFEGFSQISADAIPDGILPKRQVAGTGVTTATSSSATPTTMSSSESPSVATTSISSPSATPVTSASPTPTPDTSSASPLTTSESVESTTVPVVTTDSSGSVVTSNAVTSATITRTSSASARTTQSSEAVVVGSSTIHRSTLSSALTVTSALVGSQTVHTTFTSVFTSNGRVITTGISTDEVVATTTGFATSTISPSVQDNGDSGSSLSDSSKKIIGGVVGGVGGAILLGGIALVAWRLWGKKKRQQLPQDDYMDSSHASVVKESRESTGLERYQQPVGGPVNTASNF